HTRSSGASMTREMVNAWPSALAAVLGFVLAAVFAIMDFVLRKRAAAPRFELLHLQEGSGHPLYFCGISVSDHVDEGGRHYLPGQAEFVLEPAARALFAARAQLDPEIVDLLLSLTVDLEGDRLAEFELRAAV